MGKLCASRTAIVTGAGGGLGKCYAKALAEAGANVVVNDINPKTAGATVREIIEHGGSASPDHSDITDHVEAGKIFGHALEKYGDVNVVVNNAGVCRDRMFASLNPE